MNESPAPTISPVRGVLLGTLDQYAPDRPDQVWRLYNEASVPIDCLIPSAELLHSLFELFRKALLPERFAIIGVAREQWTDDHFREQAQQEVRTHCAGSTRVCCSERTAPFERGCRTRPVDVNGPHLRRTALQPAAADRPQQRRHAGPELVCRFQYTARAGIHAACC